MLRIWSENPNQKGQAEDSHWVRGLLVPSLLTRLLSNTSQGLAEKMCNLFPVAPEIVKARIICQSLKAKSWNFKQKVEFQTKGRNTDSHLQITERTAFLESSFLFPCCKGFYIRSTPHVVNMVQWPWMTWVFSGIPVKNATLLTLQFYLVLLQGMDQSL